MVNTSQQVGGSVGTSLLSTLFASAVASYAASHAPRHRRRRRRTVHGYTTAFWWAAGIFASGFLLTLLILPGRVTARSASFRAALARHGICNCHYAESADGAAVSGSSPATKPSLAP